MFCPYARGAERAPLARGPRQFLSHNISLSASPMSPRTRLTYDAGPTRDLAGEAFA